MIDVSFVYFLQTQKSEQIFAFSYTLHVSRSILLHLSDWSNINFIKINSVVLFLNQNQWFIRKSRWSAIPGIRSRFLF